MHDIEVFCNICLHSEGIVYFAFCCVPVYSSVGVGVCGGAAPRALGHLCLLVHSASRDNTPVTQNRVNELRPGSLAVRFSLGTGRASCLGGEPLNGVASCSCLGWADELSVAIKGACCAAVSFLVPPRHNTLQQPALSPTKVDSCCSLYLL